MLTGRGLDRYRRRTAHRALYEGRTREGCQPDIGRVEIDVLAAEVAPRVLESPSWADQSAASQLDWIATEVLRLARMAEAVEDGFRVPTMIHARYGEYPYLSVNQLRARFSNEIAFPNIERVVEGVLSHRVAWISGRVLDPPNGGGYRPRLGYFIRWRDRTVVATDLVHQGEP